MKHQTQTGTQRLLWLTDPHFEKASPSTQNKIIQRLESKDYDIALATGDIAIASTLSTILPMLAEACSSRPLFVVLGNHDFLGADVKGTLAMVDRICKRHSNLTHLATHAPVRITEHNTLVGHHGLSGRINRRRQDSVESSQQIRRGIFAASKTYTRLLVATHYPPFRTAVMFDKKTCGSQKPSFCHPELGYQMINLGRSYDRTHIQVLAGHTHHAAEDVILHNLKCRVGAAGSGHTGIQEILMV